MTASLRSLSASAILLLLSCGGAGPGVPSGGAVTITLDPASATLSTGDAQQFNAHVANSIDASVTWSVDEGPPGGHITIAGLYTAPATAGAFHVRAVSNGDNTVFQVAPITVTAPVSAPVISSFKAAPASVPAGSASTLSWAVTGATSIVIDQGVTAGAGASVQVTPAATTTYALTATGPGGTATAQATVTVTAPARPVISSFTATPALLVAGASTALAWTVTPANATLTVDQGVGTVSGSGVSLMPAASTTYRLTATNPAGSATAAVTVTVAPAVPLPVISSFTATPPVILAGGASVLAWSVSNASSLQLNGSAVTGTSKSVSAAGTYLLTAHNAAGDVTASATVTLGAASTAPGASSCTGVVLQVDTAAANHSISRYIYGYNAGSPAGAPSGATLLRSGGNRWTAYNWETNASNAGSDYLWENDAFLTSSSVPGEANRPMIAADRAAGVASLITIPIQGYVSADENSRYDQNAPIADHFLPSLPRKGLAFAAAPDLTDKFVYQDEYLHSLLNQFSGAVTSSTAPVFFSLDNEPDLWSSTHSEIERSAVAYEELIGKSVASAAAIKDAAPGALIYGPVSYGFNGYTTLQGAVSYTAEGEDWFLDRYLRDLKAAGDAQGRRLLDVLDLHWYSEATGGGVRVNNNDNSLAVQLARVQAPRSLWDPTYLEKSWITQSVLTSGIRLIPRLRQKIADGYPGTGLAFTEYNHGGGDDITGAVAQADTLGVFGREGVEAASFWPLISDNRFIHGAYRAFRDYDGAGGAFGDTSVSAASTDDAQASIYASVDAGNPDRVVLVVINKNNSALCTGLRVAHSKALATAHLYQVTASSPVVNGAVIPQQLAAATVSANAIDLTLPAWSVTTVVLAP